VPAIPTKPWFKLSLLKNLIKHGAWEMCAEAGITNYSYTNHSLKSLWYNNHDSSWRSLETDQTT